MRSGCLEFELIWADRGPMTCLSLRFRTTHRRCTSISPAMSTRRLTTNLKDQKNDDRKAQVVLRTDQAVRLLATAQVDLLHLRLTKVPVDRLRTKVQAVHHLLMVPADLLTEIRMVLPRLLHLRDSAKCSLGRKRGMSSCVSRFSNIVSVDLSLVD